MSRKNLNEEQYINKFKCEGVIMIAKKELLKGTKEELEDYFYNEVGVIKCLEKYSEENSERRMENVYFVEATEKFSISNQLNEIYDKGVGIVSYLKCVYNEQQTVKNFSFKNPSKIYTVYSENKFVFVRNPQGEQDFINTLTKMEN